MNLRASRVIRALYVLLCMRYIDTCFVIYAIHFEFELSVLRTLIVQGITANIQMHLVLYIYGFLLK